MIKEALRRYQELTFPDPKVGGPDKDYPQITGLNVHVNNPYKPMDFEMDESC